MRITRLFFVLLLLGAGAIQAGAAGPAEGGVRIAHVYFGWRDADSFKRIAEYFDGREHTGGQVILRTHPKQRSGYYFLARLAHTGAPVETRLVLQIITPEAAAPKVFQFSATLPDHDIVLNLGLTGADWPDKSVNVVAWKLEVLGPGDKLLATETSYLWDKPVGR